MANIKVISHFCAFSTPSGVRKSWLLGLQFAASGLWPPAAQIADLFIRAGSPSNCGLRAGGVFTMPLAFGPALGKASARARV